MAKKPPSKSGKAPDKKKTKKDLKVRQLTEDELSKVSGGMRRDQGDKSRQTVCR
jgi:bacteriocin-like protein